MPIVKADNRKRLIQAAVKLTYKHGFARTSLADIAKEAEVPVGNVYYYFKTKEEIGNAIVDHRLEQSQILQQEFDKAGPNEERLCRFVQMTLNNREMLARGGCPIGTFCSELHKDSGALARKSTALFSEILDWMEAQFKAFGKEADARELAVHLLSALQGVSLLAHTFHDPDMVTLETKRLQAWIRSLQTEDVTGGK
jgi:AcrR family transcriptional regulator